MKYAFFHIATNADAESVRVLNQFLSGHRVLEIDWCYRQSLLLS